MAGDGVEDVVIAVKSAKDSSVFSPSGGILCAKASMLLRVSSYFQ